MNLLTWGVDLVEEQLLASAGGPRGGGGGGGGGGREASTEFSALRCRRRPAHPPCAASPGACPPPAPLSPPRPAPPAGIPSRPNVAPRPLRNIAEYSVNALRTGRLRDLDFLKPYQGRPDVLYANPLVEAGDRVRGQHPLLVAGALPRAPTGFSAGVR